MIKSNEVKMSKLGNSLTLTIHLWDVNLKVFRHMEIVFDTGASVTTISKAILRDAGYEFDPNKIAFITTASGQAKVNVVNIPLLKIGNQVLKDVTVYAHDFPQESCAVAVLGLNVISQFNITMDFKSKKFIFEVNET